MMTGTCPYPIPQNIFTRLNKLLLDREKAARLTFGFATLVLVYRYGEWSLVHQLRQPLLFDSGFDYTYWIYQYLRLPGLFVGNKPGALLFDLLLFTSTLFNLITAAKSRVAVLVCALAWTLYSITFDSYVCHFNQNLNGLVLLPFAFLAKKEEDFRMVWEGARYFCLYIYVDAFIHKASIGGNLFYFPEGVEIIKTNQAQFLLQNPGSALVPVYSWFITHSGISYAGFVTMVMLQGIMGVGFFTKKWDKYLFFVPILFHLVNYFFVDVFFFELLVLNLTLLPLLPPQPPGEVPQGPPVRSLHQ
jgi:hypothetical protein